MSGGVEEWRTPKGAVLTSERACVVMDGKGAGCFLDYARRVCPGRFLARFFVSRLGRRVWPPRAVEFMIGRRSADR